MVVRIKEQQLNTTTKPLNQNKMKEYKKNYGGVEEDWSGKAFIWFFIAGITFIIITTALFINF